MRFPIRKKLFYSHFIAVLLVSGSIGTYFYHSATSTLFSHLRNRLMNSAALISRTIDARDLTDIRNPSDAERPSYQKNLHMLRDFQAANEDIAFIYVMRRQGEGAVFIIDSDTSDQQALPGRPYMVEAPNMHKGFAALTADNRIICDEWGCFLSGYAPLKNGKGEFLLGIDMRADEVRQKFRTIRIAGIISLLLSLFLAYLFSLLLAARFTRPIRLLVRRSTEIADEKFVGRVDVDSRDELGDLAAAFNMMSDRLSQSHERTQQAMEELKEARDSLEMRVVERTARLAEVNDQLRQEIEDRKRAEAALEKAATTDYLTGLLNRRAMISILEQEVKLIRRSGSESSLILVDMDHFKDINDRFGHEAGDRVLAHLARVMKGNLRDQDALARWGGEELLILLPQTTADGAAMVAEKIRAAFADQPINIDGKDIRVTASFGVCPMTGDMSIDAYFRGADQALYKAKAEGRNRTVLAG